MAEIVTYFWFLGLGYYLGAKHNFRFRRLYQRLKNFARANSLMEEDSSSKTK